MNCGNKNCVNLNHLDIRVTRAVAARIVDDLVTGVCEPCRRFIDRHSGGIETTPALKPDAAAE